MGLGLGFRKHRGGARGSPGRGGNQELQTLRETGIPEGGNTAMPRSQWPEGWDQGSRVPSSESSFP